jgi:hypothetical protein
MGYDHTMILDAKIAVGTSVQQVAEAFKPLMQYAGYDGVTAFSEGRTETSNGDEFSFDPDTGNLEVRTYGDVGYGYGDIVREVAANLGAIVSEAGEIWLYDHDTGDIDEAKTVIEFGPSEEAIKAYIAKRDIEAGLKMMDPHLHADVLETVRRVVSVAAPGTLC